MSAAGRPARGAPGARRSGAPEGGLPAGTGGRRSGAPEGVLPVAVARLPAFLLLAAFAARAWAQMVEPAASGAVVAALLVALAGGAGLCAVAHRRPRRGPRAAATVLVGTLMLLAALAAAGVPDLVRPHAWDDLAAGLAQGLSAVPTVRVPYRGADQWTRIVIVLGCVALVVAAALLAFAPRRGGALGFPIAAAIALGTLYTVPTMQHDGTHPFLAGAAFAMLLAVFLWLERVERRTGPMVAGVVAAAILVALVAAPRLDGASALLDYERIARSLSSPSTRYDWDHDYGPLSWPRDGREVLRIRARDRAYWKAADLTAFDGRRWVQAPQASGTGLDAGLDGLHPHWRQTLRVTVRALSSSQFVAAGTTLGLVGTRRAPILTAPGVFATRGGPLERGNAYRAVVYAPRPSERDLRAAARRPLPIGSDATSIVLPAAHAAGPPARTRLVTIAPWGRGASPRRTVDALEASPYAGAYELARRLRARSASPYDFMRAVERHLSRGYTYSEDPRSGPAPLADFLFGARSGYCQQFSGTMALLLRLGGVPARVAAGFAPGVLDRRSREYVVRDLDAHSWVEVFFPRIGWVTRDPTPADSPARSQLADVVGAGQDAAIAPPDDRRGAAGQRAPDVPSARPAPAGERRRSPAIVAALALAGTLALIGLLLAARRRRAGAPDLAAEQLAELRRALRRSARPPSPPTTLDALAARYRGTPAEGYVRALAALRYGYGEAPATPAQRAALRRELAFGLGLRGRLRAWWALPPRAPAPAWSARRRAPRERTPRRRVTGPPPRTPRGA